jgi:hypothetical protein
MRNLAYAAAACAVVLGVLKVVDYFRANQADAPQANAAASATGAAGRQPPASAAAKAVPQVKEYAGPLDRLKTVAGEVTITDAKSKDGMVTKSLALSGKTIYDQSDYTLNIERAFDYQGKTVLLLAIGSGGNACPSEYRFLTIRADGSTSATDTFGTCSDVPTIKVTDDRITVSLPDMQGRGQEAWTYANEGLSKTQLKDASIERDAPRLSFTEETPTRVRGTLVRDQAQKWWLHFPKPTQLNGGAGSFCASVVEDLPIEASAGATIPKADGEADFVATIACPHSGAVITAIQLPNAAGLWQDWYCQTRQPNGSLLPDRYSFKSNGDFVNEGGGIVTLGSYGHKDNLVTVHISSIRRGNEVIKSNADVELSIQELNANRLVFQSKILKTGTVRTSTCSTDAPQVVREPVQQRQPAQVQQGGDRVAAYANNLAKQIENSPHPACAMFASNLRMVGNSGAPEYVRMRQVEAMFDKVPGICM